MVKMIKYNQKIIGLLHNVTACCQRFVN